MARHCDRRYVCDTLVRRKCAEAFARVVIAVTDQAVFGAFQEAAHRYFPCNTRVLQNEKRMAIVDKSMRKQKALGALRNPVDNTHVTVTVEMDVESTGGAVAVPMEVTMVPKSVLKESNVMQRTRSSYRDKAKR